MGLFLLSWKQQVYSHEKLYQNAEEAWTQSGSAKEKMTKNLTFIQPVLWLRGQMMSQKWFVFVLCLKLKSVRHHTMFIM